MKLTPIVALTATLLAGCASMYAQTPAKMADGVLVGPNDMTLYTFDKDTAGAGQSACNGQCATNWPPFVASSDEKASGDYTLITRGDGKMQWAVKGKPLYFWHKDAKPGDKTGDGFMKMWHTATP